MSLFRRTALMLSTISILSCSGKDEVVIPEDVMPIDSMSAILPEVHLLTAASQHREARKQKYGIFVFREQERYFDSLGISEERFSRSLAFYSSHSKLSEKLYDEAINILKVRLAEINAQTGAQPTPAGAATAPPPEVAKQLQSGQPPVGQPSR